MRCVLRQKVMWFDKKNYARNFFFLYNHLVISDFLFASFNFEPELFTSQNMVYVRWDEAGRNQPGSSPLFWIMIQWISTTMKRFNLQHAFTKFTGSIVFYAGICDPFVRLHLALMLFRIRNHRMVFVFLFAIFHSIRCAISLNVPCFGHFSIVFFRTDLNSSIDVFFFL